ncbi:MAG: hypothetical protein ACO2ZM_00565, partial [Francisellaceae bacterium]
MDQFKLRRMTLLVLSSVYAISAFSAANHPAKEMKPQNAKINVSQDQPKSAYQGSEANKKSINFLSESVNPATGAFSASIPLLSLQGYFQDSVSISFNAYAQGILGLPDGWQYNIDYVVPGKSVTVGGNGYSIDFNWADSSGYKSGLKYFNQHGNKFSSYPSPIKLPEFNGRVDDRFYKYMLSLADGTKEYFDQTGKLLAKADRFGNAISYFYTNNAIGVTGNKLDYIMDSLGQRYEFSYNPSLHQILISIRDSQGVVYTQTLQYAISGSSSKLIKYTDPMGKETTLSYSQINHMNMITQISYPNGLKTIIAYKNLPYYNASHQKENINVVSKLEHLNGYNSQVMSTKLYQFGLDNNGRNYTGYPNYTLADNGSDNLMDSNNVNFRYDVIVTAQGINPVSGLLESHRVRTIYDNMSRPVESDTYLSSQPDGSSPLKKTIYTYPLTSNQHARTINYSKPIRVDAYILQGNSAQHQFMVGSSNQYQLISTVTTKYDDYGNTIYTQDQDYNPLTQAMVTEKESDTSFDPDFNQPLTTTVNIRSATSSPRVEKQNNTLSTDHKSVVSTNILDNNAAWKSASFAYDKHGFAIQQGLGWSQSGSHQGVSSVKMSAAYSFDASKGHITVTSTDARGNTSTQIKDSMTGLVLSSIT